MGKVDVGSTKNLAPKWDPQIGTVATFHFLGLSLAPSK